MDIDKTITRVDGPDKIGGFAEYVADIKIDGVLHAKTLRSKIAKGSFHIDKVPELPSGYYIVDFKDVTGKNVVKIIYDDQVVFPVQKVKYIGQPILLVVGADKKIVSDLIEKIQVSYTEEEPRFTWDESVIHYHYQKGDPQTAFKNAKQIIEYTYETGYQEQAYLEPQGFVGEYDNGRIVLHGSIQCPYYVKNAVVMALGIGEDNVRVIQATVGGAFGGKEEYPSLIACQLAVAVNKIKKPIRLIFEREEDISVTTKRHPAKIKLEGAIGPSNYLLGIRAHVGIDAGADIGLSGVVLSRAMIAASGVYSIMNLDVSGDVYLTNTVPNGAFRGFGAPQMFFAIEMFMEHLAQDLGLDPLKFRQDHLAKQNDLTSTSGVYRDPILLPEMIEMAMTMSDYKNKAEKYLKEDTNKGIGMSIFLHGCGFTGGGEAETIKAKVRLKKDKEDMVHILIAAVDMGQGARTAFRKLVASVMEMPIENVIYDLPDTDFVPDSGPTVASRTMMIVGGLCARAAKRLKENFAYGSEQIIEEDYVQPEYIKWDEKSMQGDTYPAYSFGVVVVEAEIDPRTYSVTL
ncbi:MAG: xanthine dehydrogenase family protein, partial [Candidatus Izemoplasmatales bacterium]|nr:xanthine dehydrogenase family protein [Candidatus Izemoplasmatales bacterium]